MAISRKARNILIAVGILAVVGAIAAVAGYVFVYNKPHRNFEKASPDYTMTSDEIYNAFEADEKAASAKYQDEVILVTGPVESISEVQDGMIQVVMVAENAMLGGVKAQLHPKYGEAESYASQVSSIGEGTTVTLKCRCVGMDAEVVMDNCFIAEK